MQNQIHQLFVSKYSSIGEERFYKFLLTFGLGKIADKSTSNPALELIEYYDMFLKLYRRENNSVHLELAKQFRRAAHRIYRIMLKKKLMPASKKFLHSVS